MTTDKQSHKCTCCQSMTSFFTFFCEYCAKFSTFANKIRAKLQELSQHTDNKMEETLEKEIPPSEVKDSNEGGIRLRLRDRDLLKKRKAEAEEKATNQWVYGAQSIKRVKKTSGTPGRKGRPRKEPAVVIPEDFVLVQETDPTAVTLPVEEPVLPTIAETVPLVADEPQPEPSPIETISEKPLEFLIEDLGPDEEEDLLQKSLIIDTGDDEQPCIELNREVSVPVYPPASAPSQPESLSETFII